MYLYVVGPLWCDGNLNQSEASTCSRVRKGYKESKKHYLETKLRSASECAEVACKCA